MLGLTNGLIKIWDGILAAANRSKCDHLVVSAIGCGAFCNPPEEVAYAFLMAVRT